MSKNVLPGAFCKDSGRQGRRPSHFLFALILSFLVSISVSAQQEIPELRSAVTDQTGTLGAQEKYALEQRLRDFSEKKGSQVAVLIVNTVKPEAIEQYSIRVVDKWKLGRKEQDDGVLLLIAKEDRELRIEVGYGLEGALTDALSHRIIDEIITPKFKDGYFATGVSDGVDAIIKVIEGEGLPEASPWSNSSSSGSPSYAPPEDEFLMPLFIVFFVGGFIRQFVGKGIASTLSAIVGFIVALQFFSVLPSLGIALLIFVLTLLGVVQHGRSSSSSGSSSGGSFRGGGGSFGGGGASGRW